MIYSAIEETNILKRTISSFRSRKHIREYLESYGIEYDKTKFNKTNLKRLRNIEELLKLVWYLWLTFFRRCAIM